MLYPIRIPSGVRFCLHNPVPEKVLQNPQVDGHEHNVTVKGRRFTVCDPTYIGATIGESMPQFKNGKVKIIML
jgi:hypothetical protein